MKTTRWIVVIVLACGGCRAVAPWQRETLAAPHMQRQVSEAAAGQLEGVRELLEGTTFSGGASGAAGGGCGCN
jgi:hypothetical protein